MRIAFGGYCHESNGIASCPVTQDLVRSRAMEGEALLRSGGSIKSYLGGFVSMARELEVELVPTFYAFMVPSGPSTREAFEYGRDRLVELLVREHEKQPLDGIALFLHGAGVAEGYPDLEGEVLRAVREKLGSEIPVGLVMDLHGNVTEEMVQLADFVMGCKCYPHVDEYDAGRQMFWQLVQTVRTGKKPYKRLIRLPWHLLPTQGLTEGGPAGDVRQLCRDREAGDPALLQASFFHGFPYANIPQAGVSVVTMGATQAAADRNALEIAQYAWDRRADFRVPVYGAKEAVALALQAPEGPVLINESADNPGGGGSGSSTHLLRAMLEADVPAAFGFLCDPAVVQQAVKAGVGATIRCSLGGKDGPISGAPLELEARVKTVSDGNGFRKSPMGKGHPLKLGMTVCLEVGKVQIVVATARTQTFDDGPFILGGVDWTQMRLLGLKSSQHFKGWWAGRVQTIIPCDPPGVQSADLTSLPLDAICRDYYPLKPDRQWEPVLR